MKGRTRVKICGITRQVDATLAVALGADALGFIFWPRSPRVISPAEALRIHDRLPTFVTRVGVFVDASPQEVATVVREARLDAVQLHGDEPIEAYQDVGARLLKVATLASPRDVNRVSGWDERIVPLVDAIDLERRGGTGVLADWAYAARLASMRPIVLAGGLTAANVGPAIARVRPWGIDVSSGVEEAPGVKSPDRLREFFAALPTAQQEDV